MKCKDAYTWLLGAESPAAPTTEVAEHLRICQDCWRRQQRLALLDQEFHHLPAPVESGEGRVRLFARLEQFPGPVALPRGAGRVPRGEWRWRMALSAAMAASILVILGLGWWFGPRGEQTPAVSAGPRDATVGRIFEGDLRLAQTTAAGEQLRVLAGIADDLRGEALYLARQGAADDLVVVRGLYERVVAQGLVRRALRLGEQDKRDLLPPLIRDLRAAAAEAERLADQSAPGVARHLRALGGVARATAENLAGPAPLAPRSEWPSPVAARPGTPRALLGALVVNGLRLAEEPDPLRRADYCSDIADNLLLTIHEASAAGNSDQATLFGKHLSDIINWGVATNLALVDGITLDGPRQAELERVLQKNENTTATIILVLNKAPEPAKAALEAALEASTSKGKGKGHNKDKTFIPPGHLKQLEKGKGK